MGAFGLAESGFEGRQAEATAEFERCLASAADAGVHTHVEYQHAGKCAYDFGDWTTALTHFREALRLREALGDPELTESSRLALDAADACATAAAAAAELHRLVPGTHAAVRPIGAPVVAPAQPNAGVLVDCRTLLLAGPVPLAAMRAIHRYQPDRFEHALRDLAERGWLAVNRDAVSAPPQCADLLRSLMTVMDAVLSRLWGSPTKLLDTLNGLVAAGRGTSEGSILEDSAFDALADAGHPGDGTVAGRLFTALCAMRYHRADVHAAAWLAEGLTVETIQALDAADPQRRRIEAATDRMAARPYRTLTPTARAELVSALRAVPV